MNTIGHLFKLTTFGESHGKAIGGVIDGCPSQLKLDFDFIDAELQRRMTAQTTGASQRQESDHVEWLSGLLDGVTLGTPIAFMVRNEDAKSGDYEAFKDVYRPSHADFTYEQKYGIRDWRGGGRASARTTLPIVVAGAIAKQILKGKGITIAAEVAFMGDAEQARREGDTVGGVVECRITGVPSGLGEPMFGKFSAELAHAMFSLPAVKGFEVGDGSEGMVCPSVCPDVGDGVDVVLVEITLRISEVLSSDCEHWVDLVVALLLPRGQRELKVEKLKVESFFGGY